MDEKFVFDLQKSLLISEKGIEGEGDGFDGAMTEDVDMMDVNGLRNDYNTNHGNNYTDDDIIMADYTEELSMTEEIISEENNIKGDDGGMRFRKNITDKTQECTINKDNVIHDDVEIPTEEHSESESFPNSKSLILSLFKPEDQGYKFGSSRIQNQTDYDTNQNTGQFDDDTMEQVPKAIWNNGNLTPQSLYTKYDDRNVVIHNHFYNFVTPPYNSNHNMNNFNDELAIEDKNYLENESSYIRTFENIKKGINLSLFLVICYFTTRQLVIDISQEYSKLQIREIYEREQCRNEYNINKCDEYGQLPALKAECLEWKICFSEGTTKHLTSTFISKLVVDVMSRMLNESLNNIGMMNRIFILLGVFLWYTCNFACGYVKGMASARPDDSSRHHLVTNELRNNCEVVTS